MRSLAILSVIVVSASACQQAKAPPAPSAAGIAAPEASGAKLAKVAFLDQETACDCTRKRIDATWAALQTALGTPATLAVERIHVDTESASAETYTVLKPLMVTPGIYFLDARDSVVEMLQGEVTAQQITAVLKRP